MKRIITSGAGPACGRVGVDGARSIDYRNYLPELARKPQAVRQTLRDLLRNLGAPYPAVWDHLHTADGPRDAARLFAKLHGELETRGAVDAVPMLEAALTTGTRLIVARPAAPAAVGAVEVPSRCARST